MTFRESLKKRLINMFFFSIWFLPLIGLICLAGWAEAPFVEYLFWYTVGAVASLPLFLAIDRAKK